MGSRNDSVQSLFYLDSGYWRLDVIAIARFEGSCPLQLLRIKWSGLQMLLLHVIYGNIYISLVSHI